MGWESNSIFQVLIVTGSTGSGVFVYSPSPGLGNLVASITAAAGTDPYGNAYLRGIADYIDVAGTISVVNLDGGVASFAQATSPAGPFTTLANFLGTEWTTTAAGGAAEISAATNVKLAPQVTVAPNVSPPFTAALLEVIGVTAPADPAIEVVPHAAGDQVFGTRLSTDTNNRLGADGNGAMSWGSGLAAADCGLSRPSAHKMNFSTCDLDIGTVGRGLQIKEGANARQGTAVLVGGTVTVANTSITSNTRIYPGQRTPGGAVGAPFVSSVTNGVGFTITSTSATDTSIVAWLLVESG